MDETTPRCDDATLIRSIGTFAKESNMLLVERARASRAKGR